MASSSIAGSDGIRSNRGRLVPRIEAAFEARAGERQNAGVLGESIAREAAYLDGLADAIRVLEEDFADSPGVASEPVFRGLMRERRGCFAAGVAASMVVAGLAVASALAGLVTLAIVQFAMLGIGFIAVFFARDPFRLDASATARETAAWRRHVELRLNALDARVRERAEVVEALSETTTPGSEMGEGHTR